MPLQSRHYIGVRATLLATAVALMVGSTAALACGESLYRVGKGVAYREYTAPLPGTILIVARDEAEHLLAEALSKAGHNVEVVADINAVRSKLENGKYDIIMSRFEHHGEVDTQIADTGVDYLPVAKHDSSEVAEAKAQYARSFSTEDNIKTYLRKIHRTLKTRKA
jgi:hypothetical protein